MGSDTYQLQDRVYFWGWRKRERLGSGILALSVRFYFLFKKKGERCAANKVKY